MKRDVDGDTTIESDRWKILIEEGLEHNNLIALFEEGNKYGILSWPPTIKIRPELRQDTAKAHDVDSPSFAPLVIRISDSTSRSLPNCGL